MDFAGSTQPTVKVGWQFALVDAHTRDLSNNSGAVIAEICENRSAHTDLLCNTVEIVSGTCNSARQAMEQLCAAAAATRRIAQNRGMELLGAGGHPFALWSAQKPSDTPGYAELINRTQWWGRQMLIWGVHVHVGVSSVHKIMPIMNSLLNYYPHLLALSASSPWCAGEDTGYASNKAMMFQQLPTAGLPFQFQTWDEFERFIHDHIKTGIIDNLTDIRWDIRPLPRHGTLEMRICDGVSNLRELGALVALTHCLVVDLDRRLDAGQKLPTMPPWHVQENKWRAARYGLDAVIILDSDSNERLITDDLPEVLNRLEPVAKSLGCADELAAVADIPATGASYQRQRTTAEAHNGDLHAVVDALIAELKI